MIDFSRLGRVRFELEDGSTVPWVLYECDDCGALVRGAQVELHRIHHPDTSADEDLSDLTGAQKAVRVGDTVTWHHEGFGTNTGAVVNADAASLRVDGPEGGSWLVSRADVIDPK